MRLVGGTGRRACFRRDGIGARLAERAASDSASTGRRSAARLVYQNVPLMQALTDKGYDVNDTWSMNTHGQRMGGPILPEMMRWLWRDRAISSVMPTLHTSGDVQPVGVILSVAVNLISIAVTRMSFEGGCG